VAGNPRKNALFDAVSETGGLRRLGGGVRSRMRTRLRWQFPADREIYREFRDFGSFRARRACKNHCPAV